eukprot:CAMPEP_0184865344 /NCGR_PEP_ID=MMETSP0580-20130426/17778_1 /TAXON_ID=1118495 /ORGANISM="Dactyliosolen fragilissimus" /LENGTH=30 /DNA_ID= /DNA_START= /DNA_END= /DNA_ORIENTATION=
MAAKENFETNKSPEEQARTEIEMGKLRNLV